LLFPSGILVEVT